MSTPWILVASHHHVRNGVGLFDVGHMVQSKLVVISSSLFCPPQSTFRSFRGPTATAFLEWLTPSSLSTLAPYTSTLSVLLNSSGGIIDDTIITKHSESAYYVVTNAGRRERDLQWFRDKLTEWNKMERAQTEGGVEHELLDGWGLLALQGAQVHSVAFKLAHYNFLSYENRSRSRPVSPRPYII